MPLPSSACYPASNVPPGDLAGVPGWSLVTVTALRPSTFVSIGHVVVAVTTLTDGTVRLTGTFLTALDSLTDPAAVTLKYRPPATGTFTTLTYPAQITRDSTGVFHVDFVAPTPGRWWARWEGVGSYPAATQGSFTVTGR